MNLRLESYNAKEIYQLASALNVTYNVHDVRVTVYDTGDYKYCLTCAFSSKDVRENVKEIIKDLELEDLKLK